MATSYYDYVLVISEAFVGYRKDRTNSEELKTFEKKLLKPTVVVSVDLKDESIKFTGLNTDLEKDSFSIDTKLDWGIQDLATLPTYLYEKTVCTSGGGTSTETLSAKFSFFMEHVMRHIPQAYEHVKEELGGEISGYNSNMIAVDHVGPRFLAYREYLLIEGATNETRSFEIYGRLYDRITKRVHTFYKRNTLIGDMDMTTQSFIQYHKLAVDEEGAVPAVYVIIAKDWNSTDDEMCSFRQINIVNPDAWKSEDVFEEVSVLDWRPIADANGWNTSASSQSIDVWTLQQDHYERVNRMPRFWMSVGENIAGSLPRFFVFEFDGANWTCTYGDMTNASGTIIGEYGSWIRRPIGDMLWIGGFGADTTVYRGVLGTLATDDPKDATNWTFSKIVHISDDRAFADFVPGDQATVEMQSYSGFSRCSYAGKDPLTGKDIIASAIRFDTSSDIQLAKITVNEDGDEWFFDYWGNNPDGKYSVGDKNPPVANPITGEVIVGAPIFKGLLLYSKGSSVPQTLLTGFNQSRDRLIE